MKLSSESSATLTSYTTPCPIVVLQLAPSEESYMKRLGRRIAVLDYTTYAHPVYMYPSLTMNQLVDSCNNFLDYPKNLIQIDALECRVSEYFAKLKDRSNFVFSQEDDTSVDFLDLYVGKKGMYASSRTLTLIFSSRFLAFETSYPRSLAQLKTHLTQGLNGGNGDPLFRFL